MTSVDWQGYASLRLDYAMPAIETVFVVPANVSATGAGGDFHHGDAGCYGERSFRRGWSTSSRGPIYSGASTRCLADARG